MKITSIYEKASATITAYRSRVSLDLADEEQASVAAFVEQCSTLLSTAKVFDEAEQGLVASKTVKLSWMKKATFGVSLASTALAFKKQLDALKTVLASYETLSRLMQGFIQTHVVPFLEDLAESEVSILEQMMPTFVNDQRIYARETAEHLRALSPRVVAEEEETKEGEEALSTGSSASIASCLGGVELDEEAAVSANKAKLMTFLRSKTWKKEDFTCYWKHSEPIRGFTDAYSSDIAHMIVQMEAFFNEIDSNYVVRQLNKIVGADEVLQEVCIDFIPWVVDELEVGAEFKKFVSALFCAQMLSKLPYAALYEKVLRDCPIVRGFIGGGVKSCSLLDQVLVVGAELILNDSPAETFKYLDLKHAAMLEEPQVSERVGEAEAEPALAPLT